MTEILKTPMRTPYFDCKGIPIFEGDLLKRIHFRTGSRWVYQYFIIKAEYAQDGSDVPFWRLYSFRGESLCRALAVAMTTFVVIDGHLLTAKDGSLCLFYERKQKRFGVMDIPVVGH